MKHNNILYDLNALMIIFTLGFYDVEDKINNLIKNKKDRHARTENVTTQKLPAIVVLVFQ